MGTGSKVTQIKLTGQNERLNTVSSTAFTLKDTVVSAS